MQENLKTWEKVYFQKNNVSSPLEVSSISYFKVWHKKPLIVL